MKSGVTNLGTIYSDKTIKQISDLAVNFEIDIQSQQISSIFVSNQDSQESVRFKQSLIDLFNVNHLGSNQVIDGCFFLVFIFSVKYIFGFEKKGKHYWSM